MSEADRPAHTGRRKHRHHRAETQPTQTPCCTSLWILTNQDLKRTGNTKNSQKDHSWGHKFRAVSRQGTQVLSGRPHTSHPLVGPCKAGSQRPAPQHRTDPLRVTRNCPAEVGAVSTEAQVPRTPHSGRRVAKTQAHCSMARQECRPELQGSRASHDVSNPTPALVLTEQDDRVTDGPDMGEDKRQQGGNLQNSLLQSTVQGSGCFPHSRTPMGLEDALQCPWC